MHAFSVPYQRDTHEGMSTPDRQASSRFGSGIRTDSRDTKD